MELSRVIAGYSRPVDLGEFEEALSALPAGTRILAGGTDLMVRLRSGRESPGPVLLLSLGGIGELAGIKGVAEGWLEIGAMTRLSLLASSPLPAGWLALRTAAHAVAGPSIRNTATIGGNVCNASPSADLSVALMALGAELLLRVSGAGERRVRIEDFFLGPGRSCLRPGEYLRSILLPPSPDGFVSGFRKLGQRAVMEIAIVNLAISFRRGQGGRCEGPLIALGAVGPTVFRATRAEGCLAGIEVGGAAWESAIKAAAGEAFEEARPISDLRASAEYRRDMVRALVGAELAELGNAALALSGGRSRGEGR